MQPHPRFSWRDILALSLLILLILLFLNQALRPGKILLPLDIVTDLWAPWREANVPISIANESLMDAVNYIYPTKAFMGEMIQSGTFPMWNPYTFTGYPFTYNTQAGMFYPLSLLYYLMPPETAFDLFIIVQMMLGAGFMFLYLRRIQLKREAALIGASIFIFNGLMISWLEWQVVHAAIIWLPAQFYLVEKIADGFVHHPAAKQISAVAIEIISLGLLVAIPWLAGHWSWTLYGSMTLGVYMLARFDLVRAGRSWVTRRSNDHVSLKRGLIASILSLGIGVALSAIQVIPAFNYLSQTHRQPISIRESLEAGLLDGAIIALIPNFFGNPIHDNWWGMTYGNFVEGVFYCGILTLFLSGLAWGLRRDFHTRFFSIWGGIALLWGLGTPAYLVLYILPVFNGVQPSRAIFLVPLSLSILAALAADKLMDREIDRPRFLGRAIGSMTGLFLLICAAYILYYRSDVVRTFAYLQPYFILFGVMLAGSLALLFARIRYRMPPPLFGWLVLFIITADLFIYGYSFNTVSDTADLYPETPASAFLTADSDLYRITTPAEGWAFLPNTTLVLEIPNLSGYEPGVLNRVTNLLEVAEGESTIRFNRVVLPLNGLDSPILDMLNVKYVTTMNDYWADAPELGAAQPSVTSWINLPMEQTFTLTEAGLQRIDIPLQVSDSAAGTVRVDILSEDGGYEFANSQIDVAEIENGAWTSFFFTPFPSPWGRTFRVRVEFIGSEGDVTVGAGSDRALAYNAYFLPRPNLAFEEGVTRIYVNEGYFPRAFIVPQAQIVADEDEALSAIASHVDRLRDVVFLELEGQPPPPILKTAVSADTPVTIVSYDLNRVELAVDLEEPGFLVLSDTYYAGWRAEIDGEPTPLYRANSLVRAVYVPAGSHTVSFRFLPMDFVIGAATSLTMLLLCVIGLGVGWRRRRLTARPTHDA